MHGNTSLGGPVWWVFQVLILSTIVLAVFVLVDSLTPRRRERVAGRLPESLWSYAALNGIYLALLLAVQIVPGIQLASAVVALATPFALALDVAYLLRVVFPKQRGDEQ